MRVIRDVAPARHDDLRREGWLPPPRPHHVPHGLDGGVRGGRRPDPLPARRRAVAAAQDLLQRRVVQGPPRGDPRGHARRGPREPVCRVAGQLEAAAFRRGDDARSPAPTTSRRATARCIAHATQVDPDGFWFQVPREIQQRVWAVEEFELAVSYVPGASCRGRPLRRARLGGGGRRAGERRRRRSSPTTAAAQPGRPSERLDPAERQLEHADEHGGRRRGLMGGSGNLRSGRASGASSPSSCSPSRCGCSCAT